MIVRCESTLTGLLTVLLNVTVPVQGQLMHQEQKVLPQLLIKCIRYLVLPYTLTT